MKRNWQFPSTGGQRFPGGICLVVLMGIMAGATSVGCGPEDPEPESIGAGGNKVEEIWFRDVTEAAGIRFRHVHGGSGQKNMVETMGSGVCFLDYDGDGFYDLYFVNSGRLPGFPEQEGLGDALYRNSRDGSFEDVTGKSGLGSEAYGMGCAVGDYDNDGDPDLFLANYGPNQLYRNNGDGTFTEITERAGVGDPHWGVSATFLDYDADGNLDLYVANYVEFSLEAPTIDHPGPPRNIYCGKHREGYRAYCSPKNFPGRPDVLYRNNGDGTFADVTRQAGVFNPVGKGLGVVTSDYDDDDDVDLYVANDLTLNFLYRNRGDGTFEDVTFPAGVGFGEEGKPQAGMGTDFGDFDGDGRTDLVVCNLSEENNSLYRNLGDGTFEDVSFQSGTGAASVLFVGFGTDFFDFDLDGDLDLYMANGHIIDNIDLYSDNLSYAEEDFLWENLGSGRFRRVPRSRVPCFYEARVGRGVVTGDYDNDGDRDVVVTNSNQEARIYENLAGSGRHWIGFLLEGTQSNRDGFGAVVLVTAAGRVQREDARGGSSYASQNDPRLHFGLADTERVDRVEIRWPSGLNDTWEDLPVDRYYRLREGEAPVAGIASPADGSS